MLFSQSFFCKLLPLLIPLALLIDSIVAEDPSLNGVNPQDVDAGKYSLIIVTNHNQCNRQSSSKRRARRGGRNQDTECVSPITTETQPKKGGTEEGEESANDNIPDKKTPDTSPGQQPIIEPAEIPDALPDLNQWFPDDKKACPHVFMNKPVCAFGGVDVVASPGGVPGNSIFWTNLLECVTCMWTSPSPVLPFLLRLHWISFGRYIKRSDMNLFLLTRPSYVLGTRPRDLSWRFTDSILLHFY